MTKRALWLTTQGVLAAVVLAGCGSQGSPSAASAPTTTVSPDQQINATVTTFMHGITHLNPGACSVATYPLSVAEQINGIGPQTLSNAQQCRAWITTEGKYRLSSWLPTVVSLFPTLQGSTAYVQGENATGQVLVTFEVKEVGSKWLVANMS